MFTQSRRIATIRGIDVRMTPSWVLLAGLVVFTYHRSFTGSGRSLTLTLVMAAATAVLFTASVLAHELAHALEGRHRGIEVGGITLFLLGGATALRDPDRHAADEFAIAAIGPWANVTLAALFGLVAHWAGSRGLSALADVSGLVGWLNVGLAVFNLVPGAPLDGGRILRALVWAVTGSRSRATVVAAVVGMTLALGLIGWSLWVLATRPDGLVPGVWAGLIGSYVLHAARVEFVRGRLARWLARHTVADLAPATPRLPAAAPAAEAMALLTEPDAAPGVLVDRDGEPVGVVRGPVTREATVGELAAPLDGVPRLRADAPGDLLAGLLDREQPFVLVEGPTGTWLSCLTLVDDRVHELRGASDG